MEKEFNRNRSSYRPRRDDSRDDYQSGRRYNGRNDGERRDRNFDNGDRRPRTFGNDERRERSFGREDFRSGRNSGREDFRRERTFNREDNRNGRTFNREDNRRERSFGAPVRERRPRIREERQHEYVPRDRSEISENEKEDLRRKHYSKKKVLAHRLKNEDENAELRLNRYIAMSGVCSRRDADDLITSGRVKVNGVVVQTVGQKVKRSDSVELDGNVIFPERKVYLVLNKPKDFVTTVEDPLERKTVMSLIKGACKERIYPVGRLDRQTTGVLLFTNDGDLAKKLTHPKFDHKKIYHVFLDKPLAEADFETIAQGIELEDGFIKADEISYTSPDCTEVGIEIHSGKNRIVRRIFEHFGYQILKLDRVYFAGITKKNVPRGKWRFLTFREVNMLKVY